MSERTLGRWAKAVEDGRRGPITHARKLSSEEATRAIAVACSEDYCDLPPMRIVAKLAERGEYVASASTLGRLLRKEGLNAHRSRAKAPERREKVVTIAEKPNQVWCWDISNLRSRDPGIYYKLYLYEDLYSRKIVGFSVENRESDDLAAASFSSALKNENINGHGLRLHSDNGSPMRGVSMLQRLQEHGVTPSFSRPNVSDDNPFVEACFKTMKYSPRYPTKPFASLEAARDWVSKYVDWYNDSHLHSNIGYVTPSQRHQQLDEPIQVLRRETFAKAREQNPIRWTKHAYSWPKPKLAALNPYGTRMVAS